MNKRLLAACALLLLATSVAAAELLPFGKGEMARQLKERQGRPFVLTLWSIDCPHCKDTLRQLAALAKIHPRLDLVVVSTDNLGEQKTIRAMLGATGLAARTTWVFGDDAPERLRFEIDRRWGGEMPRTYLFDGDHQATAYSGAVDAGVLRQWAGRHFGAERHAAR